MKPTTYSVGTTLRLTVERQTVYADRGHAGTLRESTKTVTVRAVRSDGQLVVTIQGSGQSAVLSLDAMRLTGCSGSCGSRPFRYDVKEIQVSE